MTGWFSVALEDEGAIDADRPDAKALFVKTLLGCSPIAHPNGTLARRRADRCRADACQGIGDDADQQPAIGHTLQRAGIPALQSTERIAARSMPLPGRRGGGAISDCFILMIPCF
jgi:hypothetical protein